MQHDEDDPSVDRTARIDLDRLELWLCGATLIVAAALRFPLLFCGLYTDEGGTYTDIANPSIAAVVHHVTVGEFNPPGYFVTLWLWTKVAGLSEPMLKLPSLLFGLGSVVSAYVLGRLASSLATAMLASALMALSITAIILSAAARPYALANLLSTMAIIAFIKIFYSRTPGWWALAFWLFAAALALVHYSGLILLVGLSFAAMIIAAGEALWKRFVMFALSGAAVILAFLPQMPHFIHDSSPMQVRGWLEASQSGGFASRFLEQLGFVVPFAVMRLQIVVVCLAIVLAAVVGAVRWMRRTPAANRPPLIVAMTACLLIATLIETMMFMHDQRYMFVFASLGCVLLAIAVRWSLKFIFLSKHARATRIGLALVLLWLLVGVISAQPTQYVHLYRNLALSGLRAASVDGLKLDRDGHTLFVLVPDSSAGVFAYYARDTRNIDVIGFPYRRPASSTVHAALVPITRYNWKLVLAQINSLVPNRYYRIAVVEAPRSFPNASQAIQGAALLNELSATYRKTYDKQYTGYQEPAILEVFQTMRTAARCSMAGRCPPF